MGETGNSVLDKSFQVATGNTITGWAVVRLISGSGLLEICDEAIEATGTGPIGVAQVEFNEGVSKVVNDWCPVRLIGISKVVADAAVGAGKPVKPTQYGRVILNETAGARSVGITLQAATAQWDEIDVLLTPGAEFVS